MINKKLEDRPTTSFFALESGIKQDSVISDQRSTKQSFGING